MPLELLLGLTALPGVLIFLIYSKLWCLAYHLYSPSLSSKLGGQARMGTRHMQSATLLNGLKTFPRIYKNPPSWTLPTKSEGRECTQSSDTGSTTHLNHALKLSSVSTLVNIPLYLTTAVSTITRPCQAWNPQSPGFTSFLLCAPRPQGFDQMGHTRLSGMNSLQAYRTLPHE